MKYADCEACGCLTNPADITPCTSCGDDCCHGCLHNNMCATCIDIWREYLDFPPIGKTST